MSTADREETPTGWIECSIGDVTQPISKVDPKSNCDRTISYVDISSIDNKRHLISNPKKYQLADAPSRARQVIEAEDVLFATVRPYLRNIAAVPEALDGQVASTGFSVLRPAPDINPKFLFYKAISGDFVNALSGAQYGVSYPAVRDDQVRDQRLLLPPAAEQCRIVAKLDEFFSELDHGIENLERAREQLRAYRQALLKHACEGKLTAQWREENKDKLASAEQLLKRIPAPDQPKGGRKASTEVIEGVAAMAVNKPKKPPPSGWSWVPLLRVARQETGHTPSRKHPEYWGGDQLWVGIADARLHHGKQIHETIQKPTHTGLDNSSARILPTGTVCLSRTASVGYVCIMAKPMATSQDFATWTCSEALEPKFLMYALMAEGKEIRRFGKGTTHTTIYFPEIRALHLCLPPLREQRLIVDLVEAALQRVDELDSEIDAGLTRCAALRQSILKRAFSGRLVPQDSSDEPASALLERIKAERENRSNKRGKRETAA